MVTLNYIMSYTQVFENIVEKLLPTHRHEKKKKKSFDTLPFCVYVANIAVW